MTTYLLDTNVLIALCDPNHIAHEACHTWFDRVQHWASCPITELGFIRILGSPSYPNTLKSPNAALEVLQQFRHRHGHVFWPADLAAGELASLVPLTSAGVTDCYLARLAAHHKGRLATLDQRMVRAYPALTRYVETLE